MIGKTLGHYRIVEKIGAGGMGEVYRARDLRLERDVAVKVLPSHLAEDAAALARFEREAKAIAALSHPNILGIFDVGSEGGIAYAVTELLDGETLRARLADGALPVRKAVDYAAQIAQGLAAAHDKGITHRDLKPENVFVTADGRVKILDFGLAKQAPPAAAANAADSPTMGTLTNPGIVMGTVAYMAPEQARGQTVDSRADLFSFGAVLYEMLAGQPAFRRETVTDTIVAILKEEPPDLTAVDPKIPAALVRLVQHCLEKNPAARYQSARDIVFALEAQAGSGSSISTTAAVVAAPKRRWIRALAAILIALALLAAGIFAGLRLAGPAGPGTITSEVKTSGSEFITNARFLNDGKTIVYSAARESETPDLFVINAGTTMPQPLLPRTHLLSASSDGQLAVLTDAIPLPATRLFTGRLATMRRDGTPRTIPGNPDVREADWSPGNELAIIRQTPTGDQLEYPIGKVLYAIPGGFLSDPRVSPDGSQVAFFEHPVKFDDRGFLKVVDRSGADKTLSEEYWGLQGLAWKDEKRVLYSASKGDAKAFQPYDVAVSGREPAHPAFQNIGSLWIMDVAKDGQWIVLNYDVSTTAGYRKPGAPKDGLFPLNSSNCVGISRDGKLLLVNDMSQSAGVNYQVAYLTTDSGKLSHLGPGRAQWGFSPGEPRVLAILTSPPQLVIYPVELGKSTVMDRGPIKRYNSARWFPNGDQILFCGNEPLKAARCYKQDIAGGLPTPVTPEGFVDAYIAPDGDKLLALDADGSGSVISIASGLSQPAKGLRRDDRMISWASDSLSFFVQKLNCLPAPLERVYLQSGKREPVREIAPLERAGQTSIHIMGVISDGAGYVYTHYISNTTLFLVQGVK